VFLFNFVIKNDQSFKKISQKMNVLKIIFALISLPITRISLDKIEECVDISDQAKEKIYTEYSKLFREYMTDVIFNRSQTKDPYTLKIDPKFLIDNGSCQLYFKNHMDHVNEASMCPWVNKIKYRFNKTLGYKYPEWRVEAHCLCDKCNSFDFLNSSVSNYGCVPIVKPETCLERSKKCGPDGYWKWIPSIEMVNVACACSLKVK
jgi:hypothetical protein